jgi:aconitate hydratase
MGLSVTGKILKEHLAVGELKQGTEIAIRIDQTLTQDATGTMAYLQFEAMGMDSIRGDVAVSYVDHNTLQVGNENADDHAYLRSVFSRPGNGICHQLHLERFGAPGKTLLGSDSHTPTGGGLGMLAIGAGGIDVAVAMGTGLFHLAVPKVVRIVLEGKLGAWVSAKDVILKVIETFSTKGNVNCVFEYSGPGLKHLDVPERATIANMGAECGVTSSVFPSDAETKRFLEAQGRGNLWMELVADDDAEYDKSVVIDLDEIEPLAARPHSPDNIATISSLNGTKVDQVMIGSCTNSSYRDLKMVARILEGRKVHPEVSLGLAPGSRQVVSMLAKEGLLSIILASGARLLENACGFCIGNSMSPPTNGVSLRTSNRNFEGRSGTQSAKVFLVSPEIAAVAAIFGRIVDPRSMDDVKYPRVTMPKSFEIDDSMFEKPPADRKSVKIVKGPGIGAVPVAKPLPASIAGVAAIKVGDKITTDHIMPAGQRLKHRSNIEAYSRFVFENTDKDFAERAAKNRDEGLCNCIIAGDSYGQGSSREHAAMCPMFLGVKVVVAKSIERIHFANLVNFGIIPLSFANPADYDKISTGDKLSIAGIREAVAGEGKAMVKNESKGVNIPLKVKLSDRQKAILAAGGLLNYAKTNAQ